VRVRVAAGWDLHHITDRTVELRKEDAVYRRLTGRDGYVLVRVEPQMTRDEALAEAVKIAERNDAELGLRVARQLMPSAVSLARYKRRQRHLAHVFGTPEDESRIGRMRP
jgi:hypothetical protein